MGAKTVRESSDSFDPPKGSFQYNPRSRGDTWSDSRSRIAIVATLGIYLLSFGFDLNDGNSRFLVLFLDFERERERETNTNISVYSLVCWAINVANRRTHFVENGPSVRRAPSPPPPTGGLWRFKMGSG